MKNAIKIIFIILSASCIFLSCKDDNFSTNMAHKLAFSTDTLSFDTVFTSVGSATKVLMVYNRNDKPVEISQIKLAGGENSPFRINVDGLANTQWNNVAIRAKDSMYVFVEVTVNPKAENLPFLVEDSLIFVTNSNVQQVKLIAYGQEAIVFRNKTIENDTTLLGEKPYLIYGDMTVNNLTIEKGCKLHFHSKANLIVTGNLTINGTPDSIVVFRGDRLDNLSTKYKYDDLPAQWGGIVLTQENAEHHINFANIRNGKNALKIEKAKLTIENSIIQNFDSCAINAKQAEIFVGNSLITKCRVHSFNILGGKIRVAQSTIGGYYFNPSASASHQTATLKLSNFAGETDEFPLEQAEFTNTIIYGSYQDEVLLDKKENGQAAFEYSFNYCLLKTKEKSEDTHFQNIIWDKNPEFVNLEYGKLPYNFELQEISPARDAAVSTDYPLDLNGNSRNDGKPDLGAYEFTVEE